MISVIIPIYNTGKLLNRMLQSIQKQSYKDLEIILINDGSTDESEQECKKAEINDERIRYFYQENAELANKKNILVAEIDGTDEGTNSDSTTTQKNQSAINKNKKIKTDNGYTYSTIASINIPKINVNYSIIDGETDSVEETDALLKISPTKFWGPDPNTVGNFCVVGHNYRNTKFFSKVPTLENGDVIEITDASGKTLRYSVYNKYEVVPEDLSCTSQLTNGKKEITLITCTNDSKKRVIVKASVV